VLLSIFGLTQLFIGLRLSGASIVLGLRLPDDLTKSQQLLREKKNDERDCEHEGVSARPIWIAERLVSVEQSHLAAQAGGGR
jgi:hypothetical protein